jgi:GTP-binding protein
LWLRRHIICRAWPEINDLMKNPFKNTAFLFGVTKYKNLPQDTGIEILLSGRSNAGKSSALNALTRNKKLARISKTPGRTTEINFFEVENNFKLLDLPGYGFAKSGHSRKKDWGPLLGEYFKNRRALKAVIVFMDIRHPLKPTDLEMIELCESFEVAYVPVLTKSDKVSKNILMKTIQQVSKATNAKDVLAISSLKETGFEKLSKVLLKFRDD